LYDVVGLPSCQP